MQGSQTRLKKLTGDLSCLSRIMALVATLKCGLSDPERVLLESYLCPDLQGGGGAGGGSDQGCEEAMDASLTYLLKTSLAKNAKENAIIHSSALEVWHDMAWRNIPRTSYCNAMNYAVIASRLFLTVLHFMSVLSRPVPTPPPPRCPLRWTPS